MRQRFLLVLASGLLLLVVRGIMLPRTASADSPSLTRTISVGFKYANVYKNRLVNAQASVNQMQKFFDGVLWQRFRHYSFIRDIMHNTVDSGDGFVNTPLGYGFGACGASSLLNKLVQLAKFRDSDGVEKPVFQTVMIWTWRGDKTYGQYGATIYIDYTGKRQRDYIWELNPLYDGPQPKITTHFDIDAETAEISMTYADKAAAPDGSDTADAAPTEAAQGATTRLMANSAPTKATVPTQAPKATATPNASAATPAPTIMDHLSDRTLWDINPQATRPTLKLPTVIPTPTDLPAEPGSNADTNAAALTSALKALVKANRFGVSIVPVGNDAAQLLSKVGVNPDMETYVASAFKGAVAIYFFENVDSKVWSTVPTPYWVEKDPKNIPDAWRADWDRYHSILYNVWTSAIWSENDSTGNVLEYVYTHTPMSEKGLNPIIAFNNWTHDSVGMSEASGLRSWVEGRTNCTDCLDERYGQVSFVYRGKVFIPNNTYSPRDLAQIYIHLATKGRELGYYDTAVDLLSTMRSPVSPSMIQYYMRKRGIQTASKDGFVAPNSDFGEGYYISTDAGLITLPDGKQFAVAFMAFDSGNLLDDAMTMTTNMLVPPPKVSASLTGR